MRVQRPAARIGELLPGLTLTAPASAEPQASRSAPEAGARVALLLRPGGVPAGCGAELLGLACAAGVGVHARALGEPSAEGCVFGGGAGRPGAQRREFGEA